MDALVLSPFSLPGMQADPNQADATDHSLLVHMCKAGNSAMVKLLLDAGAVVNQVDEEGYTELNYAIVASHRDVVKLLLEKGATTARKTRHMDLP